MPLKDPAALLDFGFDWTAWLVGNDTIVASTWVATPGVEVSDETFDAHTTTVWLNGGTVGVTYDLRNQVTTSAGRRDERSMRVSVRER